MKAFGAQALYNEAERAVDASKDDGKKDYPWAAELLDYLLNADGGISGLKSVLDQARCLYADVLRMMGYTSESPTWRNMYLTGAQEIEQQAGSDTRSETRCLSFPDDTVEAMTLEMILQYMGIMLDSKSFAKAYPSAPLTMQFITGGTEDASSTDRKAEYAKATVNARRGVLDYRILQEEEPEEAFMIHIKGSKLSIFRAFVDHETDKLEEVIHDTEECSIARRFITDCLTRFPLNFPIMTPRNTY